MGLIASIRLPECLGVPLTWIYAPRRHQLLVLTLSTTECPPHQLLVLTLSATECPPHQLLVLTLSATECPPHQLLVLTQSVSSKLELESTLFHPVFAQYAPQIAELATAEWGQVMALTLHLSATDCPPHQLFFIKVSPALRALLL